MPATVPVQEKLLSGEELLALGDIGPCELIDGRIVPLSPTGAEHGVVEANLSYELTHFARQRGAGWVLTGEVGIYTRRAPDRVRAADIVFLSKERSPAPPGHRFLDIAPDVVIEIVSPDDRWQDIRQKIEEYFAIGAGQVWIVEPANRTVLVYRSPTTIQKFEEGDVLTGEGPLEGFQLPVARLFGP